MKDDSKITLMQVIKLIIWIFLFIFITVENKNLLDYTFGKKTKEEAFLYNIVSGIVDKIN